MSELLQELVGQRISVWTSHGSSRAGTLQEAGVRWVNLAEDTAGMLLMPIENIRLIKVIGGGMTAQSEAGELAAWALGRSVAISSKASEGSFEDTGELEAFDDNWLRVRKKNDQLYFPISSIVEMRLASG